MKNVIKSLGMLGTIIWLHAASATATLNLQSGDTATINANTITNVSCGGGSGAGGEVSCTEGCQKWYNVNTWENGQWQMVPTCAYSTKCETAGNGCIKKTECARFADTNTWLNDQWQIVTTCAGEQATTMCR